MQNCYQYSSFFIWSLSTMLIFIKYNHPTGFTHNMFVDQCLHTCLRSVVGPYRCPPCGRIYKYKSGWYQHRKHECGKAPAFLCHVCPYSSKQKSSLKIHLAGKHNLFPTSNTIALPSFLTQQLPKLGL